MVDADIREADGMCAGRARAAAAALGTVAIVVAVALAWWAPVVDVAVRDVVRPDDEWASGQLRWDFVVEGLQPAIALGVGLATLLARALATGVVRPFVSLAGVLVLGAVSVEAMQRLLGRTDPHGDFYGGSLPSGHTAALGLAVGVVVVVLARRDASPWLPYLAGTAAAVVMGTAVTVQAAHWMTDALAGLGLALLWICVATCWAADVGREPKETSGPREAVPTRR
jgi:membrane-associated phospholipid phosphatase